MLSDINVIAKNWRGIERLTQVTQPEVCSIYKAKMHSRFPVTLLEQYSG